MWRIDQNEVKKALVIVPDETKAEELVGSDD